MTRASPPYSTLSSWGAGVFGREARHRGAARPLVGPLSLIERPRVVSRLLAITARLIRLEPATSGVTGRARGAPRSSPGAIRKARIAGGCRPCRWLATAPCHELPRPSRRVLAPSRRRPSRTPWVRDHHLEPLPVVISDRPTEALAGRRVRTRARAARRVAGRGGGRLRPLRPGSAHRACAGCAKRARLRS